MIQASAAFKQELENRDQPWIEEVEVNFKNGTQEIFGSGRIWNNGIVIEDSIMPQSSFSLGGAIVNKATITLQNFDGALNNLDFTDAEILIYIGLVINNANEVYQKGAYIAQNIQRSNGFVTITAYDRWVYFDKPYSESTLSWGSGKAADTVIRYAVHDCLGTPLNQVSITLPHNLVLREPPAENLTFRDVLRYIGELTGCFLRFDHEGVLKAVQFDWHADYNVIKGIYNRNLSYNHVVISGVKILTKQSEGNTDYNEYSSGTDEQALVIKDNPFIDDSTGQNRNVETVLGWLASDYEGRDFEPGEISHLSNPLLEAGDLAYVEDEPGWYYIMLVSTTTFSTSAAQVTTSSAYEGNETYIGGSSGSVNVVTNPAVLQGDVLVNTASVIGTDSASIANNTAMSKGSFALSKGVYSVTCTIIFGANATGNRRAWLSASDGGTALKSAMEVHVGATDTGATQFQLTAYLSPKRTTTYYLVVQQNSGGALACTARLAYMGIRL